MKRVLVQFLILVILLFGAYSLVKNTLRAPWSIKLNTDSITNFEHLMVSGEGTEFSITKVDSSFLLDVNGLSYPIKSEKLENYLRPLNSISSGKRLKKKQFDVLEAKGYWFDFTSSSVATTDFGIYEMDKLFYYQSQISKDYFLIDSMQCDSSAHFSYKSLLPNAINWTYDNSEAIFLRSIYLLDTLGVNKMDSTIYSIFKSRANRAAVDYSIQADWSYSLELFDSSNTVLNRFNVALDSQSNKVFLEQMKPFNSRIELDSFESNQFRMKLFTF